MSFRQNAINRNEKANALCNTTNFSMSFCILFEVLKHVQERLLSYILDAFGFFISIYCILANARPF